MTALPKVLFIGLGKMGWHMAGHLVDAGFTVIPLDTDSHLVHDFGQKHGLPERAPAEIGDVDVIVTMLPTSRIVAEALLGESSMVRPHLHASMLVVDMSSSQPLETRALGLRLGELGVGLVDAPVSGGTAGAENAGLTIMIGADSEDDADRAAVVVGPMSARIFRVGALGAGHALKSLNNFVAAAGFAAASEALIVARAYGLDSALFLDVLNVSTGRNFSTEKTLKEEVLTEAWDSGFPLALMTKDVKIAAELAHQLHEPSTMSDTVVGLLESALADLGQSADHSSAVLAWSGQAARD